METCYETIFARDVPEAAVEALEPEELERWVVLSHEAQAAAAKQNSEADQKLLEATESDTSGPLAATYALWLADSLWRQDRGQEALQWYERVFERAPDELLFGATDLRAHALQNVAGILESVGDREAAVARLEELYSIEEHPGALLYAGEVMERAGDPERAASYYEAIVAETLGPDWDDDRQLALRNLNRLQSEGPQFEKAEVLAQEIWDAIRRRDKEALRFLASKSHFSIGPRGGHLEFDDGEGLERLIEALSLSEVTLGDPNVSGSGVRFYINTNGWAGQFIVGDVSFLLMNSPKGWEWCGITIDPQPVHWGERWVSRIIETNQPLPFELFAPWQAPLQATAGGLKRYIEENAAIWTAGPFAPLIALGVSQRTCGFGPRGFYYGYGPTHQEEDTFAIDFTHTIEGRPWDNSSRRMVAAVPRVGIVASVCGGNATGSTTGNFVEILHDDWPRHSGTNRYLSRYLHLDGPSFPGGPSRLLVSAGMLVLEGTPIGPVDNTGNSALDHLHFSIHDQTRPFRGAGTPERLPRMPSGACSRLRRGASVRPTPMSGHRLRDADEGTCIASDTRPGLVLYQGGYGTAPQVIVVRRRVTGTVRP